MTSKNSAQKTVHKMLDNDPRYLRPESRDEMGQRIDSLSSSLHRLRKRRKKPTTRTKAKDTAPVQKESHLSSAEISSTSGSSRRAGDAASFDLSVSGRPTSSSASPARGTRAGLKRLLITAKSQGQASEDTSDSDTSSARLRHIQRRVSDCSTNYARQISALLRDFTISSASDLDDTMPSSRRPSAVISEHPGQFKESGESAFEAFPEPNYAVPGDFLTAHTRNCADFPGQDHGSGNCWCSIAQETSTTENSWLLPTGELSPRALLVLENPSDANTSLSDSFGNTALHLLAAREDYRDELFAMVLTSPTARTLTNNAEQTFLHVLHLSWFTDLSAPSAPLRQLLAFIHDTTPSLLHLSDIYGRTFFHRAHALLRDPELLSPLLSPLLAASISAPLPPIRDAFGFSPLADEGPFLPPRRPGSSPFSSTPPPPSSDEGAFLAYHARLVQVIQSSYTDPLVEDAAGRNGLHCLAQAILHQQAMDEQRSVLLSSTGGSGGGSGSGSGRPGKRKLDLSLPGSATSTPSSSAAAATRTGGGDLNMNTPETPLVTRLRHLSSILQSYPPHSAQAAANHYSRAGDTVLMAFITHLSDDQDDKSKTLLAILETLIRWGARIEARSRRGETALLVAARLGRKVALTTLLEHGANVHVRDVDGRGVLEVVDVACRGARDDVVLYARLEACRVLLTGRRDWGVVGKPGVVLEWKTRTDVED